MTYLQVKVKFSVYYSLYMQTPTRFSSRCLYIRYIYFSAINFAKGNIYPSFIFRTSRIPKTTATAKAAASAIGPAYMTPSIPKKIGKITINGSRNKICLVRETTAPSLAFPIEVNPPEINGCNPFTKVRNI